MIILLSHSSGKLSSVHSLLNAISSVERLSSFNFVKKEYGMESGPTEVLVLAFARDSLSSLRVKGALYGSEFAEEKSRFTVLLTRARCTLKE